MSICGTNAGYAKHYANREMACDACIQANKAYKKAWREKNKSSILESRRKYRESNKDAINARSLEWRNANRELANQMTKDWQKANLDKQKSYKRKSQRKRRSVYSEDYLESDVLSLYGSICYICNKEIDFLASRQVGSEGWQNALHIDHVMPLSKGGSDTLDNVRPVHGLCNIVKNDKIL